MQNCNKCGVEFEGKFCPTCGQPSVEYVIENERKNEITSQTWFIVLMLFVFFPVGAYFMWKKEKFPKWVRILITTIMGFIVIGVIAEGFIEGFLYNGNDYIRCVRNGCPYRYDDEDITYSEAFGEYFDDIKWRYYQNEDDEDIVEFNGRCVYGDDDNAKIKIKFKVDLEEEEFTAYYLSINGKVPYDYSVTDVITQVFDDALGY